MFSMSLPLPRVRTWGLFSCRDYTPQLNREARVAGPTFKDRREGLVARPPLLIKRCERTGVAGGGRGRRVPVSEGSSGREPSAGRWRTRRASERVARRPENRSGTPVLGHQALEQLAQAAGEAFQGAIAIVILVERPVLGPPEQEPGRRGVRRGRDLAGQAAEVLGT